MSKPHLMLVISSLGGGGAERVMVELADFLQNADWKVTVLTLEGDGLDQYPLPPKIARIRCNIMFDSRNIIASVRNTFERLRLIRQTIHDAAPHIVLSFIDMTNVRVLLSLVGTGIPVLVSERTDPRHHCIGWSWNILRRLTYRRAACVVLQTSNVAQWASGWLPRQLIRVIPNAVRSYDLTRKMLRPSELPDSKVILAMGRLSQEKGFDLLIKAFASSGLANRGWSVVILGEGPMRGDLTSQVYAAGLIDKVLMPGRRSDPEPWLRSADIFALSSRYEGFPNALLEAMQCGVACIAFDCDSGPFEIIDQDVTGHLVKDGDFQAFGEAMYLLAEDVNLRKRLGTEAIKIVDRYSQEKVYGQWEATCVELLANLVADDRETTQKSKHDNQNKL